MESPESKTCRWCAEAIKPAARICPYCGRGTKDIAINIPAPFDKLLAGLFVLGVLAVFCLLLYGLRPTRDFAPYQQELRVLESTLRISASTNGDRLVVIGSIRNDSRFAWKSLQLEVQYYDATNAFVDTATQVAWKDEIIPGDTRGFRISSQADQPHSMYASHRVFVRAARDPRSWP